MYYVKEFEVGLLICHSQVVLVYIVYVVYFNRFEILLIQNATKLYEFLIYQNIKYYHCIIIFNTYLSSNAIFLKMHID